MKEFENVLSNPYHTKIFHPKTNSFDFISFTDLEILSMKQEYRSMIEAQSKLVNLDHLTLYVAELAYFVNKCENPIIDEVFSENVCQKFQNLTSITIKLTNFSLDECKK